MIDYMFFWTDWSKCSRDKKAYLRDYDDPGWVDPPKWVEKLADKLEPVSIFIQKVLDKIHPEVRYVKIDYWDSWSVDHTLSHIILPLLKQLRDTKHGSGFIELEDVPEHLRYNNKDDWSPQKSFDFYEKDEPKDAPDIHARYEWALNEMIFAFEHLVDDSWEDKFRSGNIDMVFVPCPDNPKLSTMEDGPNHTYKCDYAEIQKVYDRIDNGLMLFGKYYRTLWD